MISKFRNLKKSNLKAPKVNEPETQRAIEKIYDDLNKLIDGVNNTKGSVTEEYDGEPGDIRLVKAQKGVYTLEARGDEGWVTAVLNGIPIAYTTIGSRSREVGADQDFTGAQGATGVQGSQGPQGEVGAQGIQGEAGFRDPDYDSGWWFFDHSSCKANAHSPYSIDHDLGELPLIVKVYFAPSQGSGNLGDAVNPDNITDFGEAVNKFSASWASGSWYRVGLCWNVSEDKIRFLGGDNYTSVTMSRTWDGVSGMGAEDGSIRVLMWKQ